MKKLLIALAMINLMFHVTGCKSKKAQEETEIVENADVEKADQELLTEDATTTGPVDESLQAALGEAPQQDIVDVSPTAEVQTGTDIASSPTPESTQTAALDPAITETPTIDEAALLASAPEAATTTPEATVNATVSSAVESTPAPEVAMTGSAVTEQTGPVDNSLMASNDTGITETPVTENPTPEAAITETPVTASTETSIVDSTVETPVVAQASTEKSVSAASSNKLKKISETEPYKHGEGFVNTVYIARPKESLKEISQNIYGADKSSDLKSINSFLAKRSPRGGDKIYYVSPNRPTDSSKTLSYYEDTGMASETYVAKKGDNLRTVAKNLLGYDNGWKEMWTTNSVESQSRLAEGETLRYWKPKQVVSAPVSTVAQNDMPQNNNAQLTDTPPVMPEPQPAQPVEAQPAQPVAQELPPPPAEMQPAQPVEAQPAQPVAQELPPPAPPQEIPPPPPAPEQMAAPTAPKEMARPHAEEEMAEEGALSQDMMMTLGGIAVLVALLALVLVRKNKKKKEAELASIENTHVGT